MGDETPSITQKAGSWLADGAWGIVKFPFQLVGGAVSGIFSGIGGFFNGIFDKTFNNLSGIGLTAAGIAASTVISPALVGWIPIKIGDKTIGQHLAEIHHKYGMLGIGAASLGAAAGATALVGGASGAISEASNSMGESSTGGTIGKLVGSGALLAGVGFLAFQAVSKTSVGGVKFAGDTDSPSTPTGSKPTKSTESPTLP